MTAKKVLGFREEDAKKVRDAVIEFSRKGQRGNSAYFYDSILEEKTFPAIPLSWLEDWCKKNRQLVEWCDDNGEVYALKGVKVDKLLSAAIKQAGLK